MIKFDCKHHFGWQCHEDTWHCSISSLVYFGGHLEIIVQTDEPVTVIVGKTSSGFFAYFKSHDTGADLSSLFDVDRNVKKLSMVCFDEKIAATVAFAINRIGHLLSSPRRKRRAVNTIDDDTPF